MKFQIYSIYCTFPFLRFSSFDPDPNNDWGNWNKEENFLCYDDIIFVALDENYYDGDIRVRIVSNVLDFKESINEDYLTDKDPIPKNGTFVLSQRLNLGDKRILDFGDDFGVNQLYSLKEIVNIEAYKVNSLEYTIIVS